MQSVYKKILYNVKLQSFSLFALKPQKYLQKKHYCLAYKILICLITK